MGVNSIAASQMQYWCQAGPGKPQGGAYSVGYSQPDRLFSYRDSDEDGWLQRDSNADCSSAVRGAINYGLHKAWGYGWGDGRLLPESTWTGSIRSELTSRGWYEVPWSDASLYPDGGFQDGDVVLSEAASGGVGHVAMVVPDGLAEAWIAEDGTIDGYVGDQTGSETRVGDYATHVYTRGGRWTHCLRLPEGGDSPSSGRSSSSGYSGRVIANMGALVAAADSVGLPRWVALGLAEQESNGENVFGHDAGGAYSGGGEVTEGKFRDFYAQISAGAVSNGVGPTQVTYPGYFFNDPDRAWWDPRASSEVGFGILAGYLGGDYSWDSLCRAGSTYNCGNPNDRYETYGQSFASLAWAWKDQPLGDFAGGGVSSTDEELEMSAAVDLLTEIRDSLRAGKEGDHYAGDMAWYSGAIRDELRSLNSKVQVISDAVTPGIAGVKFDGDLYNAVKETRKSLAAIEQRLTAQQGGQNVSAGS